MAERVLFITMSCKWCCADDVECSDGICVDCLVAWRKAVLAAVVPVKREAYRKRGLFKRDAIVRADDLYALLGAIERTDSKGGVV